MKIRSFLCSLPFWSAAYALTIPETELNDYEQPQLHQAVGLAPLFAHKHSRSIPNLYTVHFRKQYSISDHIKTVGINITDLPEYRFWQFLPGYTASLDTADLRQKVREDPGVIFVEAEQSVYHLDFENHDPASEIREHASNATLVRRDYQKVEWEEAQWNQQVLSSQDKLPTPVQYAANKHTWLFNGGNAGVDVYVVDSGVRISHKFFQGRAINWGGLRPDEQSPFVDETMDDKVGHGTHIAGIIASNGFYFGLTDGVTIISVKAVGAGGNPARIADAIRQITFVHNKKKAGQDPTWRGSVINMSWGQRYKSVALGNALEDAKKAGITLIAAAGNDNLDTGKTKIFPCCYTSTTCIASMDNNYRKAASSNYGVCVNYIAPGVKIQSLGKDNDNNVVTYSGTSFAAPHAAAAAAVFTSWLGLANGQATEYIYHNSRQGQAWGFPTGPGGNGLSINTGINLYWKGAREPFRYAGEHRRSGIKTSNTWDSLDPGYPMDGPFATITNNPNTGLVPAAATSDAGDEVFPVVGVDVVDELASGVAQAFGNFLEKTEQQLSWNTLMYKGDGLNGQSCGGVFTTQANGDGDRGCIKTDQVSNCIQAVVLNGTQTCVVRIYSDDACKNQILLPNQNRGLFGLAKYNLHMVATSPDFNSYAVTCGIR